MYKTLLAKYAIKNSPPRISEKDSPTDLEPLENALESVFKSEKRARDGETKKN